VTPQTEDHVASLQKLLQSRNDVGVWKQSAIPGEEVHIHLGPDVFEDFSNDLTQRSLNHQTMSDDTQAMIDSELTCCSGESSGRDDFGTCYHTLEQIYEELYRLVNPHPGLATVENLGQSFEGRDILGIEINLNGPETNGLIFINCGIHAREWISPATCMYIIQQFLDSKDDDEEIENMLKRFKWFFLPVLNVDGYNYTHSVDRLWRKNRRVRDNSSECVGVDLNRNFASNDWGNQECINDSCCESYPGEKAFSEKESANVAAYLSDRSSELVAFVDVHAYSQLWLSPWGRREDLPPNYEKMEAVMEAATTAIKEISGKQYIYGPSFSTIYPTYGDTVDYTYDKLGVTHSYSVELRPGEDSGSDGQGFLLSACQIIPTGKEIVAALKAITPILAKESGGNGEKVEEKLEFNSRKAKSKFH